jgi:hypothetical protein
MEHEALGRLIEALSLLIRLLELGQAPRQVRSIGKVRTAELVAAYRAARIEYRLSEMHR